MDAVKLSDLLHHESGGFWLMTCGLWLVAYELELNRGNGAQEISPSCYRLSQLELDNHSPL
jgi:hypothetical protein